MQIHIINGPNLNLVGSREPEVYGTRDWFSFFQELRTKYKDVQLTQFQSNVEGEIINELQAKGFEMDGIVLNAGAYTHTSIAIADAVASISTKVVEVHISQPLARESYRHHSIIAPKCAGSISGFGLRSYELAINHFLLS